MKPAAEPAPIDPGTDGAVVEQLVARVEVTLRRGTPRSRLIIAALGIVVATGFAAWVRQLRAGLGVTGLNDRVVWGLYIATFVFFIGISMAGTLISAILRMAEAEWRRPITRVAEGITVASLLVALTMIAADMGRPDRLLTVMWRGNLRSPIVWDVLAITTYLVASIVYLLLPLIPDLALLRDRGGFGRVRGIVYRLLALGWTGRPDQQRRLNRAIAVTSVTVIPAAIAVHSVTAWLFGMTLREGWSSPLMAPYFVASALFSGTAVIILVLAIVRRVYRLGDHITAAHFARLGRLLMLFGIGYAYLTFAEYLTSAFKLREGEDELLHALVQGPFAPLFWASLLAGTVAPVALLAGRHGRTTRTVLTASALVTGGMMLKRFLIVVPSLGLPLMPGDWASYRPTATEILIVSGGFAGFALLLILLARAVPIVSVSEIAEGLEHRAPPPPDVTGSSANGEREAGAADVEVIVLPNGDGPDRPERRRRVGAPALAGRRAIAVVVGATVVGMTGIASASDATAGDGIGVTERGRVKVEVVLRDTTGRPLPGAKVDLVVDVKLFGERREATLDEARTDPAGVATLWYRPTQAGRFTGRVRFEGASLWSASESPVVFKVARPLWRWTPSAPGPALPWLNARLVLVPVGIVWLLLGFAVWQGLAIRWSSKEAAP